MMTIKEVYEKLNKKFPDFHFMCEETISDTAGHCCYISHWKDKSKQSEGISVIGDNCVEDAYYLLTDKLHTD